ncbi:hypothetical protein QOT17_015772 [Balamuthia mandrillaris]
MSKPSQGKAGGQPLGRGIRGEDGRLHYQSFRYRDHVYSIGDGVLLRSGDVKPFVAMLEDIHLSKTKQKIKMKVRWFWQNFELRRIGYELKKGGWMEHEHEVYYSVEPEPVPNVPATICGPCTIIFVLGRTMPEKIQTGVFYCRNVIDLDERIYSLNKRLLTRFKSSPYYNDIEALLKRVQEEGQRFSGDEPADLNEPANRRLQQQETQQPLPSRGSKDEFNQVAEAIWGKTALSEQQHDNDKEGTATVATGAPASGRGEAPTSKRKRTSSFEEPEREDGKGRSTLAHEEGAQLMQKKARTEHAAATSVIESGGSMDLVSEKEATGQQPSSERREQMLLAEMKLLQVKKYAEVEEEDEGEEEEVDGIAFRQDSLTNTQQKETSEPKIEEMTNITQSDESYQQRAVVDSNKGEQAATSRGVLSFRLKSPTKTTQDRPSPFQPAFDDSAAQSSLDTDVQLSQPLPPAEPPISHEGDNGGGGSPTSQQRRSRSPHSSNSRSSSSRSWQSRSPHGHGPHQVFDPRRRHYDRNRQQDYTSPSSYRRPHHPNQHWRRHSPSSRSPRRHHTRRSRSPATATAPTTDQQLVLSPSGRPGNAPSSSDASNQHRPHHHRSRPRSSSRSWSPSPHYNRSRSGSSTPPSSRSPSRSRSPSGSRSRSPSHSPSPSGSRSASPSFAKARAQTQPSTGEQPHEHPQVDAVIRVKVIGHQPFGVFAEPLSGHANVKGLIHRSQVPRGVNFKRAYPFGTELWVRVAEIRENATRMGFSLLGVDQRTGQWDGQDRSSSRDRTNPNFRPRGKRFSPHDRRHRLDDRRSPRHHRYSRNHTDSAEDDGEGSSYASAWESPTRGGADMEVVGTRYDTDLSLDDVNKACIGRDALIQWSNDPNESDNFERAVQGFLVKVTDAEQQYVMGIITGVGPENPPQSVEVSLPSASEPSELVPFTYVSNRSFTHQELVRYLVNTPTAERVTRAQLHSKAKLKETILSRYGL